MVSRSHYHNHTHEFRTANFEYLMDIFLKNTAENVTMELDVGWSLVAGVDTPSWIRKWNGRISSLHVKAANWALGPEGNGHMCPLSPYDKIGYSYREYQAREDFGKAPQGPMKDTIADWTEIFRAASRAAVHLHPGAGSATTTTTRWSVSARTTSTSASAWMPWTKCKNSRSRP